jgi:hypothetical protein
MNKFDKTVLLVDGKKPNAALALAELDACGNGMSPRIYGDTIVVGFYSSRRSDWVDDVIDNAKKILNEFDLSYREVIVKA